MSPRHRRCPGRRDHMTRQRAVDRCATDGSDVRVLLSPSTMPRPKKVKLDEGGQDATCASNSSKAVAVGQSRGHRGKFQELPNMPLEMVTEV